MTKVAERRRAELIAFHEAAHAVIARVLGIPCLGIMMFSTGEGAAGALTQSAAHSSRNDTIEEQIRGLKNDAKVSLAGPIANVLHSGKATRLYDGTQSDFNTARNATLSIAMLVAGLALPESGATMEVEVDGAIIDHAIDLLSKIKAETETLVSDNWRTIHRVAQALMETSLMTEAELDRLIRS
jgi:ATP-dependent Zn protease